MIRTRTRDGSLRSRWGRMPLGAKVLIPIFVVTLLITLASSLFFTLQGVETDRLARDTEGRAVAIVVQGALEDSAGDADPSILRDMLRHVNLAYSDVAAICVLAANPSDPLGPLTVLAASEPL